MFFLPLTAVKRITALQPVTLRRLPQVALLLLLLVAGVSAQTSSTTASDATTPKGLAPGAPAGSYALSGFEQINLYNGNLNFHLPLVSIGGRGAAGYTMMLALNTAKWSVRHSESQTGSQTWTPTQHLWGDSDPGYGPGRMLGRQSGFDINPLRGCPAYPQGKQFYQTTLTTLTFTGPDGTEYDFRDQATGGQRLAVTPACPTSPYTGASRGTVWVTTDGSAATFLSDGAISDQVDIPNSTRTFRASGYLLLREGTRYRIDNGNVSWIRDRNGNVVSFTYDVYNRLNAATDALGRTVTVGYDVNDATYGLCDRIHFNGFGGAARTLYITKRDLGSVLRQGFALQTYSTLFTDLNGAANYGTSPYTVTAVAGVVLSNGQSYQFRYNSYGELARVVLPTGGAVEYDMAPGSGVITGNNGQTMAKEIYRRVAERRTYTDGTTLAGRTVYTDYESSGTNYIEVTSYNAGGTILAGERHYFSGGAARRTLIQLVDSDSFPINTYPDWNEGREVATESYDTNGTSLTTLLRSVVMSWQAGGTLGGFDVNPRLVTTVTTVEPSGANLVTKQTAINPVNGSVGFDQYNNQTDVWEYDYGPGAAAQYAVRHTHTDYLTTNPSNGTDYTAYTGVHIRSLPTAQKVYAVSPLNGTETLVAQSTTSYDEPAYLTPDYSPAPISWTSTGTAARGNATTSSHWLDTNNSWLATHAQYDQVGNVRATWDAKGNQAQVSYTDAFANGAHCTLPDSSTCYTYAFPTSSASPIPDPLGVHGSNMALATSTVYDYWTGHVTASTNANGKVTTADYNDPLDRLTQVTNPKNGRTQYIYNDTIGDVYLRTLTDQDATRQVETRQYFDGLGRSVRSFLYDGTPATPWAVTDTYYDALGRVAKVSNPYRVATPGSTVPTTCAACTTTNYDAVGRALTVTTPDSAQVVTVYSGNTVMVTDQAGKQRKSVTDALGRLTSVYEDPAGLNYLTSYSYDALGNLRKVNQGGQLRYFMYDSLGRLLRARNPEQDVNSSLAIQDSFKAPEDAVPNSQWTMAYSYDQNSNLSTRTDANNITTNYTYDALNRNTLVDYSNTTSNPDIDRHYDGASNGRGFFWYDNAYYDDGTINQQANDGYSVMGVPFVKRQVFYRNGVWYGYQVARSIDMLGRVANETYPSGHTVNYNYDAAGRLGDNGTNLAMTGNLGDGAARTYAQGISYNERGQLQQEQFGTNTQLYHKLHYNSRGQLYDIRLSTTPWQTDQWNWNRGALVCYYDSGYHWGGSGQDSGPDNNGNVLRAQNWVPGDDQISTYTAWDDFYSYDALNRLTQVQMNHAGSPVTQQVYTYDRWGNRTISPATTDGLPEPQYGVNTAKNQLTAGGAGTVTYDAAGNLTYDSFSPNSAWGSRTYDAENRMTAQYNTGSGLVSKYYYDGDGHRTQRIANGVETWQVYGFDGELLAEYATAATANAPQKEYGYRNGELLVTATGRTNVAAAAAGAVATASFYDPDNTFGAGLHTRPSEAIDGTRSLNQPAYGTGYWRSHPLAQWLKIDFAGARSISEVDVYTQRDDIYSQTDPTTTETFSLYGATAYIIEYWTGSAWAQVPNASVTDNNLVWRKFTFSPVMASALRLTVTGAADSVARITEVEAYSAPDVEWLVTDSLGTPRVVVDQTGSLAGIKRHDYLPFGEEMGTGGRTMGQGYGQLDGNRKKWAQLERDDETGLDYAQARYYSSAMGRFTSPDEFAGGADELFDFADDAAANPTFYADLTNPQSLNKYQYSLNNPLRYVDPNGHCPDGVCAEVAPQVVNILGGLAAAAGISQPELTIPAAITVLVFPAAAEANAPTARSQGCPAIMDCPYTEAQIDRMYAEARASESKTGADASISAGNERKTGRRNIEVAHPSRKEAKEAAEHPQPGRKKPTPPKSDTKKRQEYEEQQKYRYPERHPNSEHSESHFHDRNKSNNRKVNRHHTYPD